MVNKSNYLYWLRQDDPNFSKEVVWREMYSRFGYVFHLVQMVEYNIANILSLEEFEKETKREFTIADIERIKQLINERYKSLPTMTFGRLKSEVEKSIYLQRINSESLKTIVDYRNWLAHHCFKELFLDQETVSLEQVETFIDELNDFETVLTGLNNWLIEVFKENKTKSILLKSFIS